MNRGLVAGLLGVALLVQSAPPISAQGFPCPGITRPLIPYAQEQVTFDATAGGIGFTLSKLVDTVTKQPAVAVRVMLEQAQIRGTDNGTVTTTNGDIFDPGATFWVCTGSIAAFRGIRTGATSGVGNSTYYRTN